MYSEESRGHLVLRGNIIIYFEYSNSNVRRNVFIQNLREGDARNGGKFIPFCDDKKEFQNKMNQPMPNKYM